MVTIVGVANIKSNPKMPLSSVTEDISEVSPHFEVFGLNEITNAYWRTIKKYRPHIWAGVHENTGSHLALRWRRSKYAYVRHSYKPFHGGVLGFTPKRGALLVWLRNLKTNEVELFIVTHFINGAWNGRFNRVSTAFRQRRWNRSWNKLIATLVHHTPHKHIMYVLGDFNRLDLPQYNKTTVAGRDDIIKVFVAGENFEALGNEVVVGTRKLNTDHPARGRAIEHV